MSDRYKLQEPIGRGSWSVVYRAVDTLTGDVVAVKELIEDAGYPKREVRIGRQITHKNVCRIYDYSESPSGAKRISMEYVDGGNLRMFMEQSGPVPVETTLRMAGQVLDGLEAAHGLRVVHRDLKPENVLLTADGTVKLTDFGLARPVNAESSLDSLKGCGTPAYMAPEQLAGRDVDERADIFAFGIVLHELLSGVRVGVGEGLKLPDGVPAHVVGVIRRCLEAEPGRRFASVAEVRGALSGRRAKQRVRYVAVALIAAVAGLSGPFVLRNIQPVSNPEQNTGGHRPYVS